MSNDERARVANHLSRARAVQLPATLTVVEWTRTVADFAGLCAYCREAPMAVLEHFVPLSKGGGTTAGNCLPSCISCDDAKSGKAPATVLTDGQLSYLRSYLAARSTGQDTGTPVVTGSVPLGLRMPTNLLEALDRYVTDLNGVRSYPKLTRTDVVLGALDWVIRTRADWEARPAAKPGKKGEQP